MRSYQFTVKELVEILLRASDVRSGHWEMGLAFEIKAGNIRDPVDPAGRPGISFRLGQVGLLERPRPTPATVDAATLWPREDGSAQAPPS